MELAARPWITAGVALVLPTLQQVIADLLDGKQIDLQAAGNAAVTPFLPGSGLPPGEMPPAYLYFVAGSNPHAGLHGDSRHADESGSAVAARVHGFTA